MIDNLIIDKLNSLDIVAVAQRLDLDLKKSGKNYKALCFIHDDKDPSLSISPSKNCWCCFSCHAKGNVIGLVMKHENLGFVDACKWLAQEFGIDLYTYRPKITITKTIKEKVMANKPTEYLDSKLLEEFKCTSNTFTNAMIQKDYLSEFQMQRAIQQFHLGSDGQDVVFWYIDEKQRIREGKIMYYKSDGHRDKKRNPWIISGKLKQANRLEEAWEATYCLFGLHQLATALPEAPIAIVESEKTAIIMSQFSRGAVWMATGGSTQLSVERLRPLKHREILLYPDTDLKGEFYKEWCKIAEQATKEFEHPVTVCNVLEDFATHDQKKRKIDLIEFIMESDKKKPVKK